MNYQQVVDVLKQTATDLQTPDWDEQTGYGALNLAAALTLAQQTPGLPLAPTPQAQLSSVAPVAGRPGERAANGPATSGNAEALAGHTHILWRDQSTGENGIWVMNGVQMQSFVPLTARSEQWQVNGTGDFNGDGNIDLLWFNEDSGSLDVWFMDGTHLLSSQALDNAVVPTDWQVRTTGDFNGDGNPDIVLQEYDVTGHTTGNNVVWFMNGTSLVSMGGLVWSGEVWQIQGTADFNRDSHTDIFWYNGQDTAATWLMQGTSIAGVDVWYGGTDWQPSVVGDLNGDGQVDILWRTVAPDGTGSRQVAAWLMNGNQIASIPVFPTMGENWLPVAALRTRVPLPPTNLALSGNNTNITNTATPTITGQTQPFALVRLFDANGVSVGQGLADVEGNWQVTTLTLTEGSHTITARAIDAAGTSSFVSNPLNITVDTIAPSLRLNPLGAGGILTHASRLIGTAQGTGTDVATLQYQFDDLTPVAITFSPTGAFDQAIDLTGVTNGSHTLRVTVTDQAGLQTTEQFQVTVNPNSATQPTASDAQALAGSTHILWRDSSNGDNGIWVMNQTQVQSFVPLPNMPLNWSVPGMNDFNRDGKTDILWWDQTDGNLLLWLMDGTQVLSTQSLPSGMMGTDWQARGVGDFNGDGHTDILWQHDASSGTSIWYMNATTMISTALLSPTGPDWRIKGTADLDRNGTPDILWYNSGNSHTVAWMMQGSSIVDVANYGLVGGAWYLGGAGDLNSDGHADLLWNSIVPAAGTRSTIAWMMNGTTGVWGETLPSVSGSWLPVTPFRTTIPAPPSNLAVVGSSSNTTNTPNPTVRGQAEPFALVKLTLGDGTALGQVLADAQGNWQSALSGLAEGQHTLTARAIDAAGTSSFVSNPLNITVGTIAPTLTLNSLGAGGILTRASRLIGTVGDIGTGISTLQYQFDGLPPISISVNSTGAFDQAIDLTGITNGSHTLTLTVIDGAGLRTTQRLPVTVNPNSSATPNPSSAQDLAGPTHIFWRDYTTGDNGIWVMNQTEVQSFLPLPSADLNWEVGGLSDFNRDSKTDILWWDQSGNLNLWFMDGAQLLSTQSLSSPFAGTDWTVGGTGDFNDDGKPDILWQRQSTTENAVWLMNGTTLTSIAPVWGRGIPNWQIQGIGDFNRDGNPDIAWYDPDQLSPYIHNTGFWVMQGTSIQAVLDYNHVHGDWLLAGAGDFDHDGQADILWNDLIPNAQGTRTTALWMLQDPSLLGSQLSGHILKPTPPLWLLPDTQIPSLPLLPSVSGGWRPVSPFRTMLPLTPFNLVVSGNGGAANTPMITGQAEAFALVKLTDSNGTFLGQSLADAQGNWQVTTPALADGKYAIWARAIDAVGVSSFVSNPLNVTVRDRQVVLEFDSPLVTASLLSDTAIGGTTNRDRITSDPTIVGTLTDASPIVAFRASVNAANPTVDVLAALDQQGRFTLDRTRIEQILGNTLSDGAHTVHLQAVDQYNNVSQIFEVSFVLDTSLQLSMTLDPAFDSAPVGDRQTVDPIVSLVGQAEAGAIVKLVQTEATVVADVNGRFVFENVALALGDNAFTVEAEDIAGNQATTPLTIKRLAPNQAPTDILLSRDTIPETSAAGTIVGTLGTIDPDVSDTHQYTLVDSANGRFQLVGNELRVAPGARLDYETATSYTIKVRTTDNGRPNLFFDKDLTIRLSDINERPVFTSTPIANAEADQPYTYTIITADPENGTRSISATNLPDWLTLTDNGDGTATLTGIPAGNQTGLYAINLIVTDAGGLSSAQTYPLGVDFVLREDSRFRTSQSVSFTVDRPTLLSFTVDPSFDTARNFINDAFEVALVDAQGRSLVPTITTDREVFFNWTEGESVALGGGTTYNSATRTVTLNLTGISKDTQATLIFRLVNDDQDTRTEVRIRDLQLLDAPTGTLPPVTGYNGATNPASFTIPNFNVLEDVSSSMTIEYDQTSYDAARKLLYAKVAIKHDGTYSVDVPLLVAVSRLSDPSVLVRNPDGFTPEGLPYYDFSHLVADGKFDPSELTGDRDLVFYNPNNVQFTYDLVVLAQPNRNPIIQSEPGLEVIGGQAYQYSVRATDPNQDELTYSLLSAPAGMTINANTGAINWSTRTGTFQQGGDIGDHTVTVQVSDRRGGIAQQSYTLSVTDVLPNRPPIFTTPPEVDAYINRPYEYDADAIDPDQNNPLTYRLVNGPEGMTVDPNTGVVRWTPPAVMVLGDTIIGRINVPGENDEFTFSGTVGQRIYFDPLQFSGNAGQWKVSFISPSGQKIIDGATFQWNDNRLVTLQENGNYRIVVDAVGDHTGSYGFSLLDVGLTPLVALDTLVNGKLSPGSEDDLIRFRGSQGQRLFFDQPSNVSGFDWVIYNASNENINNRVFGSSNNDFELELPADGEYILVYRGNAPFNSSSDYSVSIITPDITTTGATFS